MTEPPTPRPVGSDGGGGGGGGSVGQALFSSRGGGGGGDDDDVEDYGGDWKAAWSRRFARGSIHSEYQESFPWPVSAGLAAEASALNRVFGGSGGGRGRQVAADFAAVPVTPPPPPGLRLPSRERDSRGKRRGGGVGGGVAEGVGDALRRSGRAHRGREEGRADSVAVPPAVVATATAVEAAGGLQIVKPDVGLEEEEEGEARYVVEDPKRSVSGGAPSSEPLSGSWQVVEHLEGVGGEEEGGRGETVWQSRAADAGSSVHGASFVEAGSGWERGGEGKREATMLGGRTLDYSSQVSYSYSNSKVLLFVGAGMGCSSSGISFDVAVLGYRMCLR